MLKITGYRIDSAHPGEEVKFYINAEYNDSYEVQLVRLYTVINLKAQV